ncbi:unnamed protein product, partial [Oppiella nova]
MDIMPQADGHTLIIPKTPAVTLLDLDPEIAAYTIKIVQKIAQAIETALDAQGEEKLTDKLSAVYLAEWQISADGDGDAFTNRNRFVGIKSDAFNIMFQQGEESSALKNDAKGQKGSRDSFGDGISTSLTYDNKDYGFAAAVAGSVDLKPAGLDGLVFGALWQTAKPSDDTVATTSGTTVTSFKGLKENAYGITAAYAIPSTPIKLKAEYISATTELDGRDDRKQDLYGIGADYNINKQARFYGVVGQQKRDWSTTSTPEKKKTVIGL